MLLLGYCVLVFLVLHMILRRVKKRAALSMERVGSTYGVAIDSLGTKAVLFVYSPKQEPRGYKVLKHDPL